ncbi:MAG TPA: cytochrome b [Burkholderiaceae bacterium]|nr:cytochrome b [Burkholderiaceae bacterium]
MNDSPERYGSITRIFHWVMAVLIIWQGMKFFDRINDGEHWIGETLVPWHTRIGSVILVLVVLRIIWALVQRNNRPQQDPATASLVKLGHFLLYATMFLMPVTGITYLVGRGFGWRPFDIEIIARGPEIPWMASLGGALHSPLAWFLLILVAGHIGIALFHHFVKKDGVLRRML